MNTTALVAEILVVGIQALVWVGLLTGALLGAMCVPELSWQELADWVAPISVALLGFAYTLGIMVDRLADTATLWLWKLFFPEIEGFAALRARVRKAGGAPAEFLDYQRSRMRIARATCFNLVVTIVVAALVGPEWVRRLAFFAGGPLLVLAAIPSWILITRAYERNLVAAAELIEG